MSKVYIVRVQGWGDDEDEMCNISAHSTRDLANAAQAALLQQAAEDELEGVVTDIEVMTVDA